MLQRQNNQSQIISRSTPVSNQKIGIFVLIPNFTIQIIIPKSYKIFKKKISDCINLYRSLQHCKNQTLSQGKPNLVNDQVEFSSNTCLSLPETLSQPSAPSITGQTPSTIFPTNFPNHLDDRYCGLQGTSTPLV